VLITDWWRSFNAGANPTAAMAKALLVNGAVDMGTADIPNFNEGWGRVNLSNVINNGLNMVYQEAPTVFANTGEQYVLTLGVPDPTKPLKVTVAWTDAPGAVGANPALVNNLDLTVVNGANTYKGNVFSTGWSTTGGAADIRNNLENVYVQNPAGSATITINATNIAGDAVLGNADPTDQGFSLVCYNCALNPDYTLVATPAAVDICAPSTAQYNVAVGQILGYNTPVTLSASGQPAGTTATFGANPVTPPGNSTLTIGNTGAAAAGSYTIAIDGNASGNLHSTSVGLNVFTAAPGAAVLTTPTNGQANVAATPTFTWNAVPQAASYSIQVATDASFTTIVASASGLANPTWTSNVALNTSTTYYWRVWAVNTCGTGVYSSVFSFTTVAAPGDCGPGTVARTLFTDGFETGLGSWTHSGTGDTWALATSNPHSGAQHVHANDPASISDQRLVSPGVALPTGQNPLVLKFWHLPNLESSGTTACYDGGILEVSTDGGATWTQVPNANLLVGPYTGAVATGFSNPLGGLSAWCGGTAYTNVIADVSTYAGQTAQFRLRLGSDSSVNDAGWDVDDVMVQSCEAVTAVTLSSVEASQSTAPAPAGIPWATVPAAAAMAPAAATAVFRRRR
jgi:hypothetical protein